MTSETVPTESFEALGITEDQENLTSISAAPILHQASVLSILYLILKTLMAYLQTSFEGYGSHELK